MLERPGDFVKIPRGMYNDLERAKKQLGEIEAAMYSAGAVLRGLRITTVMVENPSGINPESIIIAVQALQALAVKAHRGVR